MPTPPPLSTGLTITGYLISSKSPGLKLSSSLYEGIPSIPYALQASIKPSLLDSASIILLVA